MGMHQVCGVGVRQQQRDMRELRPDTPAPRRRSQAVQHDGGRFDDFAVRSRRLGFEADAVDRAIDFRSAQDVGDEPAQAIVPGEVGVDG
jgi:hypothetical protein